MRTKRSILDDGFQAYLTEGAAFVGAAGIPMLMDLKNTQIPKALISFGKARSCKNKRQYVHFYSHDREFSRILTSTSHYLELMKQFDGVISPDCSILVGQSPCLQQTNTYMNRAVGFHFQKNGIPVIPNIRWGDRSTYGFCFLGVPQNSIVSIGSHGCLRDKELRRHFKTGLAAMLEVLYPTDVLVYGRMPEDIFGEYMDQVRFHHYPSELERAHPKKAGEQ